MRARFNDLLRLPSSSLRVSTFSLEADAIVSLSPLLSTLDAAALPVAIEHAPALRIFEHDALIARPIVLDALVAPVAEWARHREALEQAPRRAPGRIDGYHPPAFSLSALERYQDCGFKYFAAHVLRLEESPEDQSSLTPRRRGQMLHDILHRFFAEWDRLGEGPISADTLERAQDVFASIAEPVLARLPESEAMLERTRLFGSPISVGIADTVLAAEVVRAEPVTGRWLEYRLEGTFSLGESGRAVPLRGVADRIDLLPGRRLRVVDYKSGAVPAPTRALQAPIYALCAQERLTARDGQPWTVDEASYVALAGRRTVIPVVDAGDDDAARAGALSAARARLVTAVDGITGGEFGPRPYDTMICRFCAFSTVCRKEYVDE
jgi:ATP-dependent helicase/nuclease subunit B